MANGFANSNFGLGLKPLVKSTGTFETNMTFVCPSIDNSSDERLKTIIDSIDVDIESISKVRIVDYFFNN